MPGWDSGADPARGIEECSAYRAANLQNAIHHQTNERGRVF
ncbi:MAG: hypothetical protein ACI4CA_01120 [Bacteroides sp.]